MGYDDAIEMIKRHEGFRDEVYLDSEGIPTGGWGHAFIEGSEIPFDVSLKLFSHDFKNVLNDYKRLNLNLEDSIREAVILDMLFNLGLPRFLGFKKMLSALRGGDYEKAAEEMLDSKWARQVKSRAKELARLMKTGERWVV